MPLLTTHVHLTIRPECNARNLRQRFGQGTVLSARLIAQPATIERVSRRAKRRRNLGALPIEAASGTRIIRHRLLRGASGDGRC